MGDKVSTILTSTERSLVRVNHIDIIGTLFMGMDIEEVRLDGRQLKFLIGPHDGSH